MNRYFLTGASGAVGSAIVPLLLADPETSVRLLLRADSVEHLAQRFEALCEFWRLSPSDPARARLQPLRGDATLPDFGLDADTYGELAADTTHIIHCAASVRMNDPLEKARQSAVGSAQAILTLARRLAASGTLKKVEFVSTVGIAGKRQGILPEQWIDEPRTFHNTYEQSKAEAEALVRAAVEHEALPITVHRPSMVIGDSRDGRIIHYQIFYYICEILSGRKTFGLYPALGNVRLDVIPVDWVADAIVAASRETDTAGHILNLCSGPDKSPTLRDLRLLVRKDFRAHGKRPPVGLKIPRAWFAALPRLAALLAAPGRRTPLSTLPIYMDYLADSQGFCNARYLAQLRAHGLALPDPQFYLPAVIAHYLNRVDRS
ncbi:SDR family oxidoreductase [Thauera sp. 2A1]|uniref:SDR family oxidoreductase n=1 Tax=Thauera sp. 2A1 TaxID=2570191 RepID=UPI00129173F5|nr:SDR family oxidoreductase [Thauera sp. 2A1]KAI5912726.1 SDR family oxidoreductase [Thauera sp. 2A1]